MSANFAPYQPPPDVPSEDPPSESSKSLLGGRSKGKQKRPWFNRDPSSYGNSYQSGGSLSDPTSVAQAYSNDPEVAGLTGGFAGGSGSGANGVGSSGYNGEAERANAWESRFGWRVDVMAAVAYLGGPVTALLFLILETQNDYVRFHAYQSALLTTPLLALLLIFHLLIPLPSFLNLLLLLASIGITGWTAYRAWAGAQAGLERYWLPVIGEVAERWVGEE